MRAVTVEPGKAGSARLQDIPDPTRPRGHILVHALAVGVCGTDLEILNGSIGKPPPDRCWMVLGHESLGEVLEAPASSGLSRGDWVVGIVRRPDPTPCLNCGSGEWDMCRNGRYTERGIISLDGYCSELFTLEAGFAVRVDTRLGLSAVLTEPCSVLAKAWEQIDRMGTRSHWQPRRVLITGAGPVGLLAALLGVERGMDVHVYDRIAAGPKLELVRDLGATYHSTDLATTAAGADIVLECTGSGQVMQQCLENVAPNGIVCLLGLSGGGKPDTSDLTALNRKLVLNNNIVFGSVNANRRHYQLAVEALLKADNKWLGRLISREVPLESWSSALVRQPDDVKPVIVFQRG
jgi:threonine dehydrogenase-like Zn-dependent dehydrogenase